MKSVSTTFTWLRLSALIIVVTLLVKNTTQQCLTRDDTRLKSSPSGQQTLYRGQHDFSLALIREINKLSSSDNLFFSPYSTYHALLLAYFVAAGQTERSLSETLRFTQNQDKIDVVQAYRFDKLLRGLAASSPERSYEFNSANKIYVAAKSTIRGCVEELLNDEIEKINFENPSGALQTINNWVETQTQGMIKDLIPPDGIDQQTNMVLVNAAFFKGMWEYKFDRQLTAKTVFYVTPSLNTIVDMMTQEGTFNHDVSDTLNTHILELPYKDSTASMYIFLPAFVSASGIENVLEKLNAQTFADIVKDGSLYPKKVVVSLPKFAIEKNIELTPVLENLGVGDLFSDTADLSTLTDARNFTLGRAVHKARIEVTEDGTKAAAATALFTFRSSRPAEPVQFICNHPFVYIIYDKQNKAILFAGIFRRPT